MTIRVCAAILRNEQILMVFHQEKERSYWTLPGGKVERGETEIQAVIREVREETGLHVQTARFLFDEPFKEGVCRCFLMHSREDEEISLGYDPEEAHLDSVERTLKKVAWLSLDAMKFDNQVSKVLDSLANELHS